VALLLLQQVLVLMLAAAAAVAAANASCATAVWLAVTLAGRRMWKASSIDGRWLHLPPWHCTICILALCGLQS
jgi:hypothetical protein